MTLKLSPYELRVALSADVWVLDLRSPSDFTKGHIPNAVNFPYLRADFAERLHKALPQAKKVAFCSTTDSIACDAATTLKEHPYHSYQVLGCLAGRGIEQWREAAFKVAQLDYISVSDLYERRSELLVIDVREPYEYYATHLPGAFLLPWYEASLSLQKIPQHKSLALICASEVRSSFVASLLKVRAERKLFLVKGGMTDWLRASLPTETGLLGID